MTALGMFRAFAANFLGHSPQWYKATIAAFLILNPVLMATAGPFVTGWFLIAEFIFCLAMALKCYPLQPGGLLALEAVILGLTNGARVYAEVVANLPVILLLMFMMAGIYFMRDLLLFVFSKVLIRITKKSTVALVFCFLGALLSAFLDALTVIAVVSTVAQGFFLVHQEIVSGKHPPRADPTDGDHPDLSEVDSADLNNFRSFLRDIVMHAAVGTALGGVSTLVGEPQNLLIGNLVGWEFTEFFVRMAPVSIPVLIVGLLTCYLIEKFRLFGFGNWLPTNVRDVLMAYDQAQSAKRGHAEVARLIVQGVAAGLLILALGLHVAEIGLIGLTVIVLQTAFNGVTTEHRLGHAFQEALPFTALLVVFFGVVAVIHDQHLFSPVVEWALAREGKAQLVVFYLANGLLSAISDNVFVATVYMTEVVNAWKMGAISREQFEHLTVAINAGTNIPSVATPNGQAAFLFLLTSNVAPLIRLSYGRMVWMALPYTISLTIAGLAAVYFLV